jgi:hypothetical protein
VLVAIIAVGISGLLSADILRGEGRRAAAWRGEE